MTATHPDMYDAELEPCWICHEPTEHGLCDRCAASPDPDVHLLEPWNGEPLDITHYELEVTENRDGTGNVAKYRNDETGRYFEGNTEISAEDYQNLKDTANDEH